jgi:hypothetical protein
MSRCAVAFVVLAGLVHPAVANDLDTAIATLLEEPGFERLDPTVLEANLSGQWLDTTAMSPGGTVGPIEKAVLIATGAIESTRTRTAISYGELPVDDMGSTLPVSFITIRHYNLGPLIHAETADAYGAENTAPIEEFGTGEHREWRLVFMPVQNNAATILDAAMRTISDADAEDDDCTSRHCLDLTVSFDDVFAWSERDGAPPTWPALYADVSDGLATPAHAVAELMVAGFSANAESGVYQWTGGERAEAAQGIDPYRFIGIDRNLGQETAIDAVLHETLLNDDSIAELALRRIEIGGSVYWLENTVPR